MNRSPPVPQRVFDEASRVCLEGLDAAIVARAIRARTEQRRARASRSIEKSRAAVELTRELLDAASFASRPGEPERLAVSART